MMPTNVSDPGDTFCRIYRENEERLRPVMESLKQLNAQPPRVIDLQGLLHAIHQTDLTPISEISAEQILAYLLRLSREYGSVQLDPVSCQMAGVDFAELAESLRAPFYHTHPGFAPRISSPGAEASAPPQAAKSAPRKGAAKRGHGIEANMERHRAIGEVVSRYAPDWRESSASWLKVSVLQDICADLDAAAESDESVPVDIPSGWRTGKTRCLAGMKLQGWRDALSHARKGLVCGEIKYSLKMLRKR